MGIVVQPALTVSVTQAMPGRTSAVRLPPSESAPATAPVNWNRVGSPCGTVALSTVIVLSCSLVKVQVTCSPGSSWYTAVVPER